MSPHDRFTVFLKAVGIWLVAQGSDALPNAMRRLHQYNDENALIYMMMSSFAAPAVLIFGGYWLLFCTKSVVQLAYGTDQSVLAESSINILPASESSQRLLVIILKTMGIWAIIQAVSGIPLVISRFHDAPARVPILQSIFGGYASPVILFACGFFLVASTTWFVRKVYFAPKLNGLAEQPSQSTSESELRELFSVITKAIGVWLFVEGLTNLPTMISLLGYYQVKAPFLYEIVALLAEPVLSLTIGCLLIFKTTWLADVAFANSSEGESDHRSAGQIL